MIGSRVTDAHVSAAHIQAAGSIAIEAKQVGATTVAVAGDLSVSSSSSPEQNAPVEVAPALLKSQAGDESSEVQDKVEDVIEPVKKNRAVSLALADESDEIVDESSEVIKEEVVDQLEESLARAFGVDEITLHPRENAMIVASHGRAIWIMDNISPISEYPIAQAAAGDGSLFSIPNALMASRKSACATSCEPFCGMTSAVGFLALTRAAMAFTQSTMSRR